MPIKFIITGLDASGKTHLSTELAARLPSLAHVEDDVYRYVPQSNWTKKPKSEFISGVYSAVASYDAIGLDSILDCAYNDVYDPERAMMALMRDAVTSASTKPTVVVLTMGTLHEAVETLLARIIKRKSGLERGVCDETMASSSGLLIKFIQNYTANMAALDEFASFARSEGCNVISGTYDMIQDILLTHG